MNNGIPKLPNAAKQHKRLEDLLAILPPMFTRNQAALILGMSTIQAYQGVVLPLAELGLIERVPGRCLWRRT